MDNILRQGGERQSLSAQSERTLFFIKPGGVMRRLMGEIVSRIERKGLLIAAMKLLRLNKSQAEIFYDVHRGKPFFKALVEHVTSGPILAMVVEGPEAISVIRRLIGETSSFEAGSGTVRGDFGISVTKNVVHASDSVENAEREISFFFKEREILRYEKPTEKKFAF
jgi:nucleoside-diphosphate kinase